MLDFYGDVVRHIGKFAVKFFHQWYGVANPIEEIRVAERNVLRAACHLTPDILHDNFPRYHAKHSVIDRHNRAVSA